MAGIISGADGFSMVSAGASQHLRPELLLSQVLDLEAIADQLH